MKIKSLSASSALVFEGCEARFKAENIDKVPQESNSAASLGTACHKALELYVSGGMVDDIVKLFDAAYWEMFVDSSRLEEGRKLVRNWLARTSWDGRTVISTEKKETFELPTSQGTLPVTFIWDRCDDLGAGEIEVVDYKTLMQPVKPDDLKNKIQVRVYALAAAIKFKDLSPTRIWVTLDMLRYEPISVAFSRDENKATWLYLRRLAERMLVSDGTKETLNSDCRYCVRKHVCKTLEAHIKGGGPLGITDPVAAAQRRYKLEGAKKAIDVMLNDLDTVILDHCREEEIFEFPAGPVNVAITASGRRTIDPASAARVLGDDLMRAYPGGISIGVVDKLLKEKPSPLTPSQMVAIKALIHKEYGDAKVKVSAADPTA